MLLSNLSDPVKRFNDVLFNGSLHKKYDILVENGFYITNKLNKIDIHVKNINGNKNIESVDIINSKTQEIERTIETSATTTSINCTNHYLLELLIDHWPY